MEIGKIATYIGKGLLVSVVTIAVGFLAGYIGQPWGSVVSIIVGIAITAAALHFADKSGGTVQFILESLALAGATLTWFAVFGLISYALNR